MRQRKKTLVFLARDKEELSLWRMRLETAGYRVVTALDVEDLRQALDANPMTAVVVSQWGADEVAATVDGFRASSFGSVVQLLLIDLPFSQDYRCDAFEGEGYSLPQRVRERIKILSQRRRGPKRADSRREPIASIGSQGAAAEVAA